MSETYSEAHRVLLTYVSSIKSVSADDLAQKFLIICERFDIDIDTAEPAKLMRDYIAAINIKIARLSFKIESVRDQETDQQVYVYINTKFDEFIQGATPYTAPELDAIKQLIDAVVNSHGFAFGLPYVNAKQLVTSALKHKTKESSFFIQRLVDAGWINLSDQNRVVLSAAGLAELKDYLKDRFGVFSSEDTSGKLLQCIVCSSFVTLGKKCGNEECYTACHSKCFSVLTRDNQICPNKACSEPLSEAVDVGTRLTSVMAASD